MIRPEPHHSDGGNSCFKELQLAVGTTICVTLKVKCKMTDRFINTVRTYIMLVMKSCSFIKGR